MFDKSNGTAASSVALQNLAIPQKLLYPVFVVFASVPNCANLQLFSPSLLPLLDENCLISCTVLQHVGSVKSFGLDFVLVTVTQWLLFCFPFSAFAFSLFFVFSCVVLG
ncbi:hypothetical protein VNO80_13729 [Phaseolus coccineus]|uniref:Uncharacterized protein n=1 Tax=Phaseolus coccineus TaxID=3886 RepID=A0AAN9N1K2_PHACN